MMNMEQIIHISSLHPLSRSRPKFSGSLVLGREGFTGHNIYTRMSMLKMFTGRNLMTCPTRKSEIIMIDVHSIPISSEPQTKNVSLLTVVNTTEC